MMDADKIDNSPWWQQRLPLAENSLHSEAKGEGVGGGTFMAKQYRYIEPYRFQVPCPDCGNPLPCIVEHASSVSCSFCHSVFVLRQPHRCFDHLRNIGNNRWICNVCGDVVSTKG